MEGVQQSVDQLRRSVRHWVRLLIEDYAVYQKSIALDLSIMEEFQMQHKRAYIRPGKIIS